jgi:hypothetical protein
MSQRLKLSDGAYVAVVISTFIVLGAIGGVLWRLWWSAPSGMVFNGQWFPGATVINGEPYLLAQPPQHLAAATAHWGVIALSIGLIGGLVAALLGRGREYAAVAVTLIASGSGAVVMLAAGLVGRAADPNSLAASAADRTVLQGRLELAEPWLIGLPTAIAGTVLAVAFLGFAARSSHEVPVKVGTHV